MPLTTDKNLGQSGMRDLIGGFMSRVRDGDLVLIYYAGHGIEADGRDCLLHCGAKTHRIDGPLAELAARLCNDRFVQVSRSSLVNIDSIAELQEMFKGDLVAIMKSGDEVPVSRRFRTQVLDRLAG